MGGAHLVQHIYNLDKKEYPISFYGMPHKKKQQLDIHRPGSHLIIPSYNKYIFDNSAVYRVNSCRSLCKVDILLIREYEYDQNANILLGFDSPANYLPWDLVTCPSFMTRDKNAK